MHNTITYLGYLRVSTERQGTLGVSLQEQRAAIERYASAHGLSIGHWIEECQSAAQRGRPGFTRLLTELRTGGAQGVILHKVDRGSRNLRDWVDLMDLLELGADVRLAGDDLDLHSRGGRLAADIQAVVAADYIRNLREESRKGILGRFRQGLYPFAAPLGYLDRGGGKLKVPDSERAQLVREAFELYAEGSLTLQALSDELTHRGLRTRGGGPITPQVLSLLLRNPWYAGLMRHQGETYHGRHLPLVSRELFERVQAILKARRHPKHTKHNFLYQGMLTCAICSRYLPGELHKGHVYYRCHSRSCRGTSLREEAVERAALERLHSESALLSEEYTRCAKEGKRALLREYVGAFRVERKHVLGAHETATDGR